MVVPHIRRVPDVEATAVHLFGKLTVISKNYSRPSAQAVYGKVRSSDHSRQRINIDSDQFGLWKQNPRTGKKTRRTDARIYNSARELRSSSPFNHGPHNLHWGVGRSQFTAHIR